MLDIAEEELECDICHKTIQIGEKYSFSIDTFPTYTEKIMCQSCHLTVEVKEPMNITWIIIVFLIIFVTVLFIFIL